MLYIKVPLGILRQFWQPEIEPALGRVCKLAVWMSMPKAAVDEHAQPVFRENQVRFARQIVPMQTVAKPQLMTHRSHEHFRLRVFALDHRHNLGAVFWGNYVCTQRMRPGLSINSTFLDTASLDFSFSSAETRSTTVHRERDHCPIYP